MPFCSTGCYNIHNCFDYVNYLLIFAYRFAGTIGGKFKKNYKFILINYKLT